MKTVRLENNIVREIIPEYALPVEKWYGEAFAVQCVEAPDEVEENWLYNAETGNFSEPQDEPIPDPTPTEEEDTSAMLIDHEYRLTLLELGITESEV